MPLDETSWPHLRSHLQDAVAVVPVGTVEPDGTHLTPPSGTVISNYLASRLAFQINGLITPPIAYGAATPRQRPGDGINTSGQAFTQVVTNILSTLARHGVRRFVIVNSAAVNVDFLHESVRRLTNRLPDARVMILNRSDVLGREFSIPPDVATKSGVYNALEIGAQLDEQDAEQIAKKLAATIRLEFNESDGV